MHTLLVEDDKKLSKLLAKILAKSNFEVDIDSTGSKTVDKLHRKSHDVVILDLNLPDQDGVELCKKIRSSGSTVPIIMLTNRSSTIDKITGLDAGADDYLPKPFHPDELIARIRAVLRRPEVVLSELIVIDDLTIDCRKFQVTRSGQAIQLMPKEFQLLEYLARKQGAVVGKSELLRHVWGIYSNNGSNRLEVYIRYLRQKIDEPFNGPLIHTVRGKGYRLGS